MFTEGLPSSLHAVQNQNTALFPCPTSEEKLSPFDYAQMCIALVSVARSLKALKAAKEQHTPQLIPQEEVS